MRQAKWKEAFRFPWWLAAGVLFTAVAGVIWPMVELSPFEVGGGKGEVVEVAPVELTEWVLSQQIDAMRSVRKSIEIKGLFGRFGI